MIKILKNKKGFTLIELIVVMAILAILAAIAIPRFANMRIESAVKADAGTAAQIANAARIQETQTGTAITVNADASKAINPTYMDVPEHPQTNNSPTSTAAFGISGGSDEPYVVTFTPSDDYHPYATEQEVTEHTAFTITEESDD